MRNSSSNPAGAVTINNCAIGARDETACSTRVLSINLTKALGRFAPNLFPAPAPAIIAAVLLIMTVDLLPIKRRVPHLARLLPFPHRFAQLVLAQRLKSALL